MIDDYVKRISHHSPIEITEVRDGEAALKKARRGPRRNGSSARRRRERVSLPRRLRNGSANFAIAEHARLIFLCGDADGFPDALRERAPQKISLSAMTFSHELARAMLAEQLYRAFAILSGSPYPK